MEKYFVINNSDGDTNIQSMSKDKLLERINENYWGDVEFFDELPKESDTNYWGGGVLIIKGSVVSPQAKTKITEFSID